MQRRAPQCAPHAPTTEPSPTPQPLALRRAPAPAEAAPTPRALALRHTPRPF